MMTPPDVHALTGPYVLDALPDDERVGFETHLADCRSCTDEVAELREVAAKLGTTLAAEPPPALKARVMALAGTTRQLPPLVQPDEPAQPAAPARTSHEVGREQPAAQVDQRRSYSRRSFFSLAAAGAAVLGSGAVALDQYRDNSRTKRQNQELAAVLAESDARTVRGAVKGGGQATVVISRRKDTAVVLLHGLRELPDDKTYQLWFMDKALQATSIGLASGKVRADQTKVVEGGLAGQVTFGLTVEDKPGAPAPTVPPVALIAMA